jgi:hypothetical protein
MLLGVVDRPANGVIDGCAHVDLVAGLDLLAQQVDLERGVHAAHLGRIVAPPVVPLGKDVDQVDMSDLECLLELALVKAAPYGGDVLGGMEIQVDLSTG